MLGGFVTTGCATVERVARGDGENGKQEYVRLNVSWEVPKAGPHGPVSYVPRYATLVSFGPAAKVMRDAKPGDRVVVLDGDAQVGKVYNGKNGAVAPLDIFVNRWLLIPREEGTNEAV